MTPPSDASSSPMPVWISDNEIDPAWMQSKTSLSCTSCTVKDISNATRKGEKVRDGATLLVEIKDLANEANNTTVVIKQIAPQGLQLSMYLGLAREALFYSDLAPKLETNTASGKFIPKIYYSWGSMETGNKVVIMEDLSSDFLDSGIFFGPGNPNNWNRDLPSMIAKVGESPPSSKDVAEIAFKAIAKVHATFWSDESLLEYGWLRASEWTKGQGKESWEASQQIVKGCWAKYLEKEETSSAGEESFQWDPAVRAAVEKAVGGISWDAQLARLNTSGHFTLVHGDHWPGNYLLGIGEQPADSLRLLDWEMVGIGSGPQDLGQYILSNMDPAERRECEEHLVKTYHAKLQEYGVSNMTWEECWQEYRIGGLERWLWFLVYFLGQDGLSSWAQFFHNQIASFMKDHSVETDEIVQPRP